MSNAIRWRPRADLERRDFEHQTVLFDPVSGDTHLLDQVSAAGLDCLEAEPLDARGLRDRMAARLAVDANDELLLYAGRLLERLSKLGLLIRLDACD